MTNLVRLIDWLIASQNSLIEIAPVVGWLIACLIWQIPGNFPTTSNEEKSKHQTYRNNVDGSLRSFRQTFHTLHHIAEHDFRRTDTCPSANFNNKKSIFENPLELSSNALPVKEKTFHPEKNPTTTYFWWSEWSFAVKGSHIDGLTLSSHLACSLANFSPKRMRKNILVK